MREKTRKHSDSNQCVKYFIIKIPRLDSIEPNWYLWYRGSFRMVNSENCPLMESYLPSHILGRAYLSLFDFRYNLWGISKSDFYRIISSWIKNVIFSYLAQTSLAKPINSGFVHLQGFYWQWLLNIAPQSISYFIYEYMVRVIALRPCGNIFLKYILLMIFFAFLLNDAATWIDVFFFKLRRCRYRAVHY